MTAPAPYESEVPQAQVQASGPAPAAMESPHAVSNTAFDVGYAMRKNKWSVAALAVAIGTLLLAIVIQPSIWQSPDWRYVAPPAVVAIGLAICGLLVREPRWALATAAVAVAGSALVLGWVLIVVGVLVAFLLALAILHQVV